MSGVRILNKAYLVPRVCGWLQLLAVALFDAIKHRQIKRRGSQLQRGLIAVVLAYVVQDILLLAFAVLSDHRSSAATPVCGSYIFFTDLADTMMIAVLLVIAAGFCITRDTLGPYKLKVLLIPPVYLVTTLVVDYAAFAISGRSVCNIGAPQDSPESTAAYVQNLSPWIILLVDLSALASLMVLLMAWLFIFDTAQKERASLEDPKKEGMVGASGQTADVEIGTLRNAGNSSRGGDSVGHSVGRPDPEAAVNQPGNRMPDSYAEVVAEDTDATKTVEEKMMTRSKLQLMRQFQWGVGAYVISFAVVLILPLLLYTPDHPESDNLGVRIVIILQNCVLWGFLVALCFIFRPREDNPYLMLEEEDGAGPSGETDTAIGDIRDVHTELGVMSSGELDSPVHKRGNSGVLRGGGGNDSPASVDRNFTLGDGDEDYAPPRREQAATRGRVAGSQIKARGASR